MIALGIAIVLGLIAVLLANTYLTGKERQLTAGQPQGVVRIAVASMPLAYGNPVTADKVKFVAYPAGSLPPGAFRSMAELLPEGKKRVALRTIMVNQPLLAADLSGSGQGASIAALLPDGMRAATVRINDISGVAGFIEPNDTVDVLITRQPIGGGGGEGKQVTDVLLQNIRVIAMGKDANAAGNEPSPASSVTLELTPLDAQKVALGQQLGQLSLVLRKPGEEQNIPNVETVSLADLRYSYYGSMKPGGAVKPTPAATPVVRVNRPRPPVVRRPIVVVPSTSRVNVTRGTESRDYEVGGYAQ
jgi:pilus assembly protein CpaB